jgi:hypothetical protein
MIRPTPTSQGGIKRKRKKKNKIKNKNKNMPIFLSFFISSSSFPCFVSNPHSSNKLLGVCDSCDWFFHQTVHPIYFHGPPPLWPWRGHALKEVSDRAPTARQNFFAATADAVIRPLMAPTSKVAHHTSPELGQQALIALRHLHFKG